MASPALQSGASPTAAPALTAADAGSPLAGPQQTISYTAERVVGHGSYGVVFLARVTETGEPVAIKKTLLDRRFRSRELQLLRQCDHPNIVGLRHCFYSAGSRPEELYLNLVMELVPDTLLRFTRMFAKQREHIPLIYTKAFGYQLLRALAYLHSPRLMVCHRDVKPQNCLIDPTTGVLKLCDFGSAKQMAGGEQSVAYIASRYYRAPELIFGATDYTAVVDLWAAGCVIAEMLLGQPLFAGESTVDQMVEIIKVLGTPSREDVAAMNRNYTDFQFPAVRPLPWSRIFRSHTPPEGVELIADLLRYDPRRRVPAVEALGHRFFDDLRAAGATLPNGHPLPPLFNFSPEERDGMSHGLLQKLVPSHYATAAPGQDTSV